MKRSFAICKTLLLFLLIIPCSFIVAQEEDSSDEVDFEFYRRIFQRIDPQTGYLFNLQLPDSADYTFWELNPGEIVDDIEVVIDPLSWIDLYFKVARSEISQPRSLPELRDRYHAVAINNNEIPIAFLDVTGNYVSPDSIENYLDQDSILVEEAPVSELRIFAASHLSYVANFTSVNFRIDTGLLFTNQEVSISEVEIDFGDGLGFQSYNWNNQLIAVEYETVGAKSISYRVHTGNSILTSSSRLVIQPAITADVQDSIQHITPNGDTIYGLYNIYLGDDGILDQPIVIVKGFDVLSRGNPADTRKKYDAANISDKIAAANADMVTVSFTDLFQDIYFNAAVLAKVIVRINELKVDNYENVVIGESMGGLISRVALRALEIQGVDHQTRLYASFDTPHRGANIPLSIQETLTDAKEAKVGGFLASIFGAILGSIVSVFLGPAGGVLVFGAGEFVNQAVQDGIEEGIEEGVNETVQEEDESLTLDLLVDANAALSARQIVLRTNYDDDFEDINNLLNPYHQQFQARLDFVGMPIQPRLVAISNGSNVAKMQQDANNVFYQLGDKYIDEKVKGITVYAKANYLNERKKVSKIEGRKFLLFKVKESGTFTFFNQNYDHAPGGVKQGIPGSFISTASSIALNKDVFDRDDGLLYFNDLSTDFLRTRIGIIENNLSPFHDIYAGPENTEHVGISGVENIVNRFIDRELMLRYFDLTDRLLTGGDSLSIFGSDQVTAGENINTWSAEQEPKLVSSGEVIVSSGAHLKVTSRSTISFRPGFSVRPGGSMTARIVLPAGNQRSDQLEDDLNLPKPDLAMLPYGENNVAFSIKNSTLKLLKEKDFSWTITHLDEQKTKTGKSIVLEDLPPGQYAITCSILGGYRSASAIFVVPRKKLKLGKLGSVNQLSTGVAQGSEFTIYPNPTSDFLKWKTDTLYDVVILNYLGQVQSIHRSVSELDVNSLSSGQYVAVFYLPGNKEVMKGVPFNRN